MTTPTRRRDEASSTAEGSSLRRSNRVGLLAEVLAPQAAFAHNFYNGRCLGGHYGLTTGGSGYVEHSPYHNLVQGSTSAQNNCGLSPTHLGGGMCRCGNYTTERGSQQ